MLPLLLPFPLRRLQLYPSCRLALEVCDGLDFAFECLLAVQWCQMSQFAPIMLVNGGMNVYDIRKECEGPLCYREFEVLDKYLNQVRVGREGDGCRSCHPAPQVS